MKQKDKELLLKDLCARLPYQPLCKKVDTEDDFCNYDALLGYSLRDLVNNKIIIKPYLRPMSSMTEEEKRELSAKYNWSIMGNDISIRYHSEGYWDDDTECPTNEYLQLFDWLNAHHFDYRGLIEKGLAIMVDENNNPYK